MKAISVRQPWAWFLIHLGKDVENRTWRTNLRGRIYIHAAQGMTHDEYCDATNFAVHIVGVDRKLIPSKLDLPRGGIVGEVTLWDCQCVNNTKSRWFAGPWGHMVRDAKPLDFRPYTGAQGYFEVADVDPKALAIPFTVGMTVKTVGDTMPVSTGRIVTLSECGRYAKVRKQYGQRPFERDYLTKTLEAI